MSRTALAACACALVLAGCAQATKEHFVQHYGLSTAAPSADTAEHASKSHRGILQIARIVVPEWLDGAAMYYRLDYRDDNRLAAYANSDWIAPPAALLEPLLQKTILAGGAWRAVIGPGNPATADAILQIRLDDFSQSFTQPHASTGVLDATATLISNRDDRVLAQRHFHFEVAAPTPDAQGGAKALNDASARFADELQQWVDSTSVSAGGAEDH